MSNPRRFTFATITHYPSGLLGVFETDDSKERSTKSRQVHARRTIACYDAKPTLDIPSLLLPAFDFEKSREEQDSFYQNVISLTLDRNVLNISGPLVPVGPNPQGYRSPRSPRRDITSHGIFNSPHPTTYHTALTTVLSPGIPAVSSGGSFETSIDVTSPPMRHVYYRSASESFHEESGRANPIGDLLDDEDGERVVESIRKKLKNKFGRFWFLIKVFLRKRQKRKTSRV